MMSDLNMSHGKKSYFVPFPLLVLTFVIKVRDFDFKLHLNTLIFFEQRKMMSDLNMSAGKISDFVSVPLFALTFVIKLTDCNFTSH